MRLPVIASERLLQVVNNPIIQNQLSYAFPYAESLQCSGVCWVVGLALGIDADTPQCSEAERGVAAKARPEGERPSRKND